MSHPIFLISVKLFTKPQKSRSPIYFSSVFFMLNELLSDKTIELKLINLKKKKSLVKKKIGM